MSKIMVALSAAGILLTAGAAAAAPSTPGYDDLDLGRPGDAAAYRHRVDLASEWKCEREDPSGFNPNAKVACQARARQAAMAAMPEETRVVYQAALKGQASDRLARARLAAAAPAPSATSPN